MTLIEKILEAVKLLDEEAAVEPSLSEILFSGKYLADYKGVPNIFYPKLNPKFLSKEMRRREEQKKKHRLQNAVYRLHKQNFIEFRKKRWQLTSKGTRKLKWLKEVWAGRNIMPKVALTKNKDTDRIIVIFDIPEKEKGKRDWLRHQLKLIEYSQLQKSVMIGHHKIPEALLKAVNDLGLFDKIHIFRIKDRGTISL